MSIDGCGFPLFLVLGVGVLAFLIWQSKVLNDTRAGNLRALGEGWEGIVKGSGVWSWPRLEMRVDGLPAEVSYREGKGDSLWTKVHIQWTGPGRLRATPQGFAKWLRSLVGGSDLEVGDPAFDAAFWVEASDAKWAREILTADIRRGLLDLRVEWNRRGSQSVDVTLDAGPAGLVLKVGRLVVDNRQALERFLALAVLILRVARGGTGIADIALAPLDTTGAACPVCGHAVEGPRPCPSCRTPHHEECWKYSGGCAIFGCRSRAA